MKIKEQNLQSGCFYSLHAAVTNIESSVLNDSDDATNDSAIAYRPFKD
jgi:hypothetical protein